MHSPIHHRHYRRCQYPIHRHARLRRQNSLLLLRRLLHNLSFVRRRRVHLRQVYPAQRCQYYRRLLMAYRPRRHHHRSWMHRNCRNRHHRPHHYHHSRLRRPLQQPAAVCPHAVQWKLHRHQRWHQCPEGCRHCHRLRAHHQHLLRRLVHRHLQRPSIIFHPQ